MVDRLRQPAVPVSDAATGARSAVRLPLTIRLLDAGILVLGLLALASVAIDDLRVHLGPVTISATRPWRLLTEAAALALIRAVVWRGTRAFGRHAILLALTVLLTSLFPEAPPRRVGDGHEYMAMAIRMSEMSTPALSAGDIRRLERTPWPHDWGYSLSFPELRGSDHQQDLPHFWFYSLLAAPGVGLATRVGVHPNVGFTAVNTLLLLLAASILLNCVAPAAALLLVTGPILWWTDKAHTEVFTFSLLAVAFGLFVRQPWWSFVALGAASTQNPPIAGVLCIALILVAFTPARRDRRTWVGAGAGIVLALLHPTYYRLHLGTWSPLDESAVWQWPSWAQVSAPVFDANIGLLPAFPALTLAALAGVVLLVRYAPRRLCTPDMWLSLGAAALFLVSFAQTPNVNHGATVGPSRYALWLIPLTIPLWRHLDGVLGRWWQPTLGVAAALSMIASIGFFHPRFDDRYLRPSVFAETLWTRWPGAQNPLPEIFAERVVGHEGTAELPVATSGCEKVLISGRPGQLPSWPASCPTVEIPAACRVPDTLCYANRSGTGYNFVRLASQPGFTWESR